MIRIIYRRCRWDVKDMVLIVSSALAGKYSSYRQLRTLQRNGDPNEHELFHFCPDATIPKIWREVLFLRDSVVLAFFFWVAAVCAFDAVCARALVLIPGLQTGLKWARVRTFRSM